MSLTPKLSKRERYAKVSIHAFRSTGGIHKDRDLGLGRCTRMLKGFRACSLKCLSIWVQKKDIARKKSAILLDTEQAPVTKVQVEQEHHDND